MPLGGSATHRGSPGGLGGQVHVIPGSGLKATSQHFPHQAPTCQFKFNALFFRSPALRRYSHSAGSQSQMRGHVIRQLRLCPRSCHWNCPSGTPPLCGCHQVFVNTHMTFDLPVASLRGYPICPCISLQSLKTQSPRWSIWVVTCLCTSSSYQPAGRGSRETAACPPASKVGRSPLRC